MFVVVIVLLVFVVVVIDARVLGVSKRGSSGSISTSSMLFSFPHSCSYVLREMSLVSVVLYVYKTGFKELFLNFFFTFYLRIVQHQYAAVRRISSRSQFQAFEHDQVHHNLT